MRRRWLVLILALLLVLSACSGGAQAVTPPTPEAATEVPPTATALPPTVTPAPPTPTPEPPTATPAPPTPTPMPVNVIENVPYIDDGTWEHLSTLYLPADGKGPYPTLLIYHSGAFWYGDQEYLAAYEEVGRFFAERGYAVVVPAYRLSQTDPYPAAVEDAFCAAAWVHTDAVQYGFDVTQVAALGLDAGADLASLVGAVDDPQRFLEGCPHTLPDKAWVQGVAAIGGYFDLPALFVTADAFGEMFQSYITHYLQATPEEAPERYAEASPITWVDGSEPPFAVLYNNYVSHCDTRTRALAFVEALEAVGVSVQTTEVSSQFWLMVPFNETASVLKSPWKPTLDDYGFPQAEAFFADLFGMSE